MHYLALRREGAIVFDGIRYQPENKQVREIGLFFCLRALEESPREQYKRVMDQAPSPDHLDM
ncbi:hypothetical protein PsorP6_017681 [Peronosclerospora sorghi]|uniref:Uncharacterized protein n=1 Tax=Peronosclerospora sorghi TaxID=230839 RepID=A0ACC0WLC6_9STRA|nr:hypothetical protein PsorP6_017681 [Peronosclerospora sorghi]